MQQFNKGPEFFENTDNYWKPASDTEGLYQQLSSKKYREILRQQIQYAYKLCACTCACVCARMCVYCIFMVCYINHVRNGVWVTVGYSCVYHVYVYEIVCLVHTFFIMGKHSQTVVRYKINNGSECRVYHRDCAISSLLILKIIKV